MWTSCYVFMCRKKLRRRVAGHLLWRMLNVCDVLVYMKVAIKIAACTAAGSFPLNPKINSVLFAVLHVALRCTKRCFFTLDTFCVSEKAKTCAANLRFYITRVILSPNRNHQFTSIHLILTSVICTVLQQQQTYSRFISVHVCLQESSWFCCFFGKVTVYEMCL